MTKNLSSFLHIINTYRRARFSRDACESSQSLLENYNNDVHIYVQLTLQLDYCIYHLHHQVMHIMYVCQQNGVLEYSTYLPWRQAVLDAQKHPVHHPDPAHKTREHF